MEKMLHRGASRKWVGGWSGVRLRCCLKLSVHEVNHTDKVRMGVCGMLERKYVGMVCTQSSHSEKPLPT